MQAAREKISNMASAAKEHVGIYKAKVEEKLEKAAARTEEEKKRAEERRKAKEAKARKELHEVKAWHAAEKLSHKQAHLRHHPAGHHDPPLRGFTATAATAAALVYGQNEPAVGTHGHHHIPPPPPPACWNSQSNGWGHRANLPPGTQLHHNKRL